MSVAAIEKKLGAAKNVPIKKLPLPSKQFKEIVKSPLQAITIFGQLIQQHNKLTDQKNVPLFLRKTIELFKQHEVFNKTKKSSELIHFFDDNKVEALNIELCIACLSCQQDSAPLDSLWLNKINFVLFTKFCDHFERNTTAELTGITWEQILAVGFDGIGSKTQEDTDLYSRVFILYNKRIAKEVAEDSEEELVADNAILTPCLISQSGSSNTSNCDTGNTDLEQQLGQEINSASSKKQRKRRGQKQKNDDFNKVLSEFGVKPTTKAETKLEKQAAVSETLEQSFQRIVENIKAGKVDGIIAELIAKPKLLRQKLNDKNLLMIALTHLAKNIKFKRTLKGISLSPDTREYIKLLNHISEKNPSGVLDTDDSGRSALHYWAEFCLDSDFEVYSHVGKCLAGYTVNALAQRYKDLFDTNKPVTKAINYDPIIRSLKDKQDKTFLDLLLDKVWAVNGMISYENFKSLMTDMVVAKSDRLGTALLIAQNDRGLSPYSKAESFFVNSNSQNRNYFLKILYICASILVRVLNKEIALYPVQPPSKYFIDLLGLRGPSNIIAGLLQVQASEGDKDLSIKEKLEDIVNFRHSELRLKVVKAPSQMPTYRILLSNDIIDTLMYYLCQDPPQEQVAIDLLKTWIKINPETNLISLINDLIIEACTYIYFAENPNFSALGNLFKIITQQVNNRPQRSCWNYYVGQAISVYLQAEADDQCELSFELFLMLAVTTDLEFKEPPENNNVLHSIMTNINSFMFNIYKQGPDYFSTALARLEATFIVLASDKDKIRALLEETNSAGITPIDMLQDKKIRAGVKAFLVKEGYLTQGATATIPQLIM